MTQKFTQAGVSRLYITFLIRVGSDKQKVMTSDDMIIPKLAAKAYDLVNKIIDKKKNYVINMIVKK